MKLLLTSAGLSNSSITKALEDLLEKPAKGVKLAFIPTAANVETGDKSWLIEDLNNYMRARFTGISAGRCIAGPTISNVVQDLFGEEYELEIIDGLGLVNFQLVPNFNSPYLDKIREENLQEAAKELTEAVYALDDESALKIVDDNVEVITESARKKFN